MLQITIPPQEGWNEKTNEFYDFKGRTIQLEHSLVSLSKWESKWHKSFLSTENLTAEEDLDYIRCMTLTQNVPPEDYLFITKENYEEIKKYISDSATATTFHEEQKEGKAKKKDIITSEILYYDMIAFGIPFECQKWHLNRLITLIRVCKIKNEPPKKMNKRDLMNRNKALNDARRKRLHSKG